MVTFAAIVLSRIARISFKVSFLASYHCVLCAPHSRVGENLEQALPSMRELILTSNNIQELVSYHTSHQ